MLRETQLLMTIPGVSFYSSLLITSEVGEIDRFDEAKQVVSYAGLEPVVRDQETRGRKGRSRSGEVETYAGSSFSMFKQQFTGVIIHTLDGFTLN
ncbi:transposase (ISH18) [Haloarcula marismortui ATCC 33799]|uniref:Transposase (ISH18) n=1 Tax=Haloarcula marismortui ATCC 33799 TaxID=662475 RepID=M0JM79_9EURY|nr:transposase (ISH18) [Haloarcula californiae ATCC 33799]